MNRHYILLPFFLLLTFALNGQEVFKLYELDKYTKNKSTPPISNGNFVDINSTLYITFDKITIAESIRDFTGSDTMSVDQMKQLRTVLANQVEIMEGFKNYAADPNLSSLSALAEQMNTFFMEGEKYPEIQDLYNEYSALYTQTYNRQQRRMAGEGDIPFRDEFIFTQMAKKATELAKQIENGLSSGAVKFLLSGRMVTGNGEREVKLSDDFDELKADVYTVPRWQTEMTGESRQQLVEIGVLSNRLNSLMDVKGEDIKNWLKNSFGAEDCIKDIEDRLISIPQVISTIAPQLAQQAKDIAKEPYIQAKKLSEAYTSNISATPSINSVGLLESFSGNLVGTADSIENLISTVDNKLLGLIKQVPSDPQIQAFVVTYDSCKIRLQQDKNKILAVASRLKALFGNSKKAAKASAGLSDKVRRLSYDAIPAESFIDLRNTGIRTNGDRMKIRAILELPGEDGEAPVRKIVEQRVFTLQQIGMYSVIKPMLLLANPNGTNNVDMAGKDFQFAPSYSILFKFGSRTSKGINNVWQPGLGVNFGALDFNTDAVPEFGAGLELTIIRDYFSFGYGYNFGADEDFFLLGFRLPVGAIPLPIFNEVQAK